MQKILVEQIEIVAVQEPWSTSNSDYWLASKRGTAAILWNRGIQTSPCKVLMKGQHLIAVKYKSMVIVSCYCSPNVTLQVYEQMLNEIRMIVTQEKSRLIICGDMNAKSKLWKAKVNDTRGDLFVDLATMLDLRLVNIGNVDTCVRHNGSSIIDITWSSHDIYARINDWRVEEDELSLSDHRYISFMVSEIDVRTPHRADTSIAWSIKHFDQDLFDSVFTWECPQLTARINKANEQVSAQDMSAELDEIMRHACDAAMPRLKTKKNKTSVYWWSDTIEVKRKECIALRRKMIKSKRRSRDNDTYIYVHERNFKHAKKELRLLIRKAKAQAWQDLIKTIDDDPWGIPYRIVMNKLRRTSPRLTEMFDSQLLTNTLDELFPRAVGEKDRCPELDGPWEEIWDISTEEIIGIIRRRPAKNTAPGLDGVRLKYLKRVNKDMLVCISQVLTLCLKKGIFPNQWKQAQLVLLPKGDMDTNKPKTRPICLLTEISKVFECVINDARINDWMETHQDSALSTNQFGFRYHRSTTDAIVELREFIEFAHKEEGVVIAIALDIRNAFNSLQWVDICHALKNKGFPIYIQRLIHNYLSTRSIIYTDEHGTEVVRNIEAGVPQGSVLGPLLWNLTFDQVIRARLENGCRIMAYADDTLVIATGESVSSAKRRANFQVARTCRNIKKLHLEVSAAKTEIIVFTPDKKPSPIIDLNVGGQIVKSQRSIKYLGVMIDEKLQFDIHLEYIEEKTNKVTRNLWRLMPNLHGPNERRRRLYAHVISSIALYAAPVWAHKVATKGKVLRVLKELHSKVVHRVIAAYKTVSHDAAAIISRIPPYQYTAAARMRSYDRIRDSKIANVWNKDDERSILREETMASFNKWKEDLIRHGSAGLRTRQAIMPVWDEWMFRNHGCVSFHLT